MSQEVRRVAVLFSRLSGYMAASLRALRERHGVELLVIRYPVAQEAPFEDRAFSWIDELYDRGRLSVDEMLKKLVFFKPEAVFMSGWFDSGYIKVAREMKKLGVPVVAGSDAQWNGSWRQQVGRVIAPWYLHSAIDVLWVAGERQRQFARRLGFSGNRCWSGYYTCDWHRFSEVYQSAGQNRPRNFLFVGRYLPIKGIDVLTDAYRIYRERVADPWGLICVGAGPFKSQLAVEGLDDRGFVQPDQLPGLFAEASAFVLPSRREPWGVVVQEAAASGLPLICSDACGAAVHLLQDRYNGFLCEAGNAEHLAQCMAAVTELSDIELQDMGQRSYVLSMQFTPELWAKTFVDGLASLSKVDQ